MSSERPFPEPDSGAPPQFDFSIDTTATGATPAGLPLEVPPAALFIPHLDPLTAEVAQALERPPPQRTWLQSALLLGISLILFGMAGFFQSTPTDLALLVGVLLFHETGHYVGMRLFNYQDVRMFFIPFFGAAVSGRSTSVQGYKEAIVLLLGPLPGIVLGLAIGVSCMFHDSPLLRSAALMLLALNGFNLLPLLPLDGGRLVHLIVFSRQRHVEALFRILTAVLLGVVAWAMGAWLLAIPAALILLGTQLNFHVSKLGQELRGPSETGEKLDLSQKIPHDRAVPLIERVRGTFPQMKQPATLANVVRQVWERMHLRPPGLAASVLLLGVYVLAFLGTPIAAVCFQIPVQSVVTDRDEDGTLVRRQEVRSWGRLQLSTELDTHGRLHGRHVEYDPMTGKVTVEGAYADGLQHGLWSYYDLESNVTRFQQFDRGVGIESRQSQTP
jgi:Zn-dependent protease